MDRVLDRLWIGSAHDLDNRVPLRVLGFSAVVDLRDVKYQLNYKDIAVHHVTNRDGNPWSVEQVRGTLDFIHDQVRRGRVLVACAAGMSRSASIVIGYLVQTGWGIAEACEYVRNVRPRIAPVAEMLDSVLKATVGRNRS